MPESRNAEQEAGQETDRAGDRQGQHVVDAAVLHQDRRGVRAERVERALAERELAAAAGQDVEREHRDSVDQHHRHLEDDEVLYEQRCCEQQHQHRDRGVAAERHVLLGGDFDGGCVGDGFLQGAHDQTRFTMVRPIRPVGLTTSTVMISASAIGSLSSLPTPGM
jgi:hypothetical protein